MATIDQVKEYWETNPLLSYELSDVGSEQYFAELDFVKRNDSDKFALPYWQFDQFAGKQVLDVGCGPGWLTVNYAKGGAIVSAIDITARGVELTQKHLRYQNATASVLEGNAEELRFDDGKFDLVVSSGVLHHTPDTPKAISECFRVTKKGGMAKLTFYCKGFLHRRPIFQLTTGIMRLLSVKHPGAALASAKDVDDFIRQYDGRDNPIGVGKTKSEWDALLRDAGFEIISSEKHYFPKRFIPAARHMPDFLHRGIDHFCGLMIYYRLRKP
jgi:ubiquinone/menaquinone biosynthesis C-methylase UbiE